MTKPLPKTSKAAVQELAGPRYVPAAAVIPPLIAAMIHGAKAIEERVHEHQVAVAADREQQRAAAGAQRAAERKAAAGDG